MPVLLIGTLDTKGAEIEFLRDRLNQEGVSTLTVDVGILQSPQFSPDVSREVLFRGIQVDPHILKARGDRGDAVTKAAAAVEKLVLEFHRQGKVDGVLSVGGSAGTTIGTAAMRVLPYGIPKLMVSTLASGQVAPFVGIRDLIMMHSVVDLCGLNRFSRQILTNAALAMVGMVKRKSVEQALNENDRPLIAASMFGVTTPCVEACRKSLEQTGFEVLVFHATGTGGRTMEAMVRDGLIRGVLDITTTELADELVGGVLTAGKDRLTAAALRGVPQVISLGALDMVNFGPRETVPERFKERRFYQHNANVTLMRTTPEENDQLGKEIAEKASASNTPTCIVIPRRGVSAIDAEGQPFWWPEADQALFQSIRNWVGPMVELVELDLHINDPEFARMATEKLLSMLPQ